MKYEQRTVYIVKYADTGEVIRVFGIEEAAHEYANKIGQIVDEWPVEFAVQTKQCRYCGVDEGQEHIKGCATGVSQWII